MAKLGNNYRMTYLTWKFPFRVFKRCSFQMWAVFLLIFSIKKFWANLRKNHRMIHLTWNFPFWVLGRCSFLIWVLILLVLCIYFNWGKKFCGQNPSKKQEWSPRLERFQAKCWNFETVAYFHSIPAINAFVLSDVLSDTRVT